MTRRFIAGAVLLGFLGGVERAAAANGVHYDPSSPSGKEYALPLDQARSQNGAGPGGVNGATAPPLFGAGVKAAAPPRRAAKLGKSFNRRGSLPREPGLNQVPSVRGASPPEARTSSVQGPAIQAGILIALAALAVAVMAALTVRRTSRGRSP